MPIAGPHNDIESDSDSDNNINVHSKHWILILCEHYFRSFWVPSGWTGDPFSRWICSISILWSN